MKTIRRHAFAAACAALVLSASLAAPAGAQTPALSESHRASVLELLELMQADATLEASTTMMLDIMLGSQPGMEAVQPALEAFFAEYFTWPLLQDRFVDLYASTFDEAEVQDLIVFFRTPTGQHYAESSTILAEQAAQIGEQHFMEHMSELERMLMESVPQSSDPAARPPWQQR